MTKNTADEFGEEQEERVGQSPPVTQFDADLAKQVARDAQRLVAGGLSEAEFYQKYHQAYLREFGVDDRPIGSGRGIDRRPPESGFAKHISRRALLKLGGIAVAGILGARWLGSRVLGAEAAAAGII